MQTKFGGRDQAAPHDGVITRLTVRRAAGTITLVAVDGPAGQRRVVGRSAAVQGSGADVQQTFAMQVPIRAGQRMGIELAPGASIGFRWVGEGAVGEYYAPALGSEAAPATDGGALTSGEYSITASATVEPDRDGDGLGDESQDPDRGGATAGGGQAGGGGFGADGDISSSELRSVIDRVITSAHELRLAGRKTRISVGCPQEMELEACTYLISLQDKRGHTLTDKRVVVGQGQERKVSLRLAGSQARALRRAGKARLHVAIGSGQHALKVAVR